ncbi:LysE family translocator [Aminivibrio sp.]|uniref:LysE family translocator n=1 Tax=Aminivibrio sp. TaxID=1872489 RepID=UPI00345EEA1B
MIQIFLSSLFVRGFVLGFSIAAPVGPIGILCIQRTLSGGFSSGLASGLGAATADSLYGLAAALGLSALSSFFLNWAVPLRTGGGFFLLFLGARAILSRPAHTAAQSISSRTEGIFASSVSAFFLTLSNPMTILSFSAIFTSLGPVFSPVLLVAGVFLGSAAWWLTLCGIVWKLGAMLSPAAMLWIRRGSGVILVLFAVSVLFA